MRRTKNVKNIAMLILGGLVIGLFGFILFDDTVSEYDEVQAYVNSDASNESKMIYLEKRYENEMGRLNILLSHSDLCSSKYLNELSTLSLSFEATLNGFDILGESVDFSSHKNLSKKWTDYQELEDNFNEMYKLIEKEEYEESLEKLDVIEKIISTVYGDVDKEISQVK